MLSFDYSMELDFEGGEAREHAFTLRCIPQETAAQHICEYKIQLQPETELSYGVDGFGNRYCYGLIHEQHSRFQVEVKGTAERWADRREVVSEEAEMLYRQPTGKTEPGPALKHMLGLLPSSGRTKRMEILFSEDLEEVISSPRERAEDICHLIYQMMTYVPGATSTVTSAEEAAAKGKGVCQDYAHIMLALCRMCGISCRYTAGLLLGEGASHAWVEICDHGEWWEMDPTNPDTPVEEKLIFSHGRDAGDCEINRGIYLGPQTQVQKISALLQKR